MLKIRLRQMGRTNRISYRLVVSDSRFRRDGKYVEMIGWYDPLIEGKENVKIHSDRLTYWLDQGAVLTEKAKSLVARALPEIMSAKEAKQRNLKQKQAQKKKEKEKAKAQK